MPSLATDELLAAYRARLRTCRLSMRHAWLRHLEALRNGCPDEIEATRDEYEATEPPFNEVAAGIASRVKLLSGGLAVGERVEIACPSGVEPVVGTVIEMKRESGARVAEVSGRAWIISRNVSTHKHCAWTATLQCCKRETDGLLE